MSLKDTFKQLKTLLTEVSEDLDKSENGNKAAAQRVRTGTIRLEKVAKLFRKESIKSEKSGSFKKPKKASAAAKKGKAAPKAMATQPAKGMGKSKNSAKPVAKPMAKAAPKAAPKVTMSNRKKATAKIIKKK